LKKSTQKSIYYIFIKIYAVVFDPDAHGVYPAVFGARYPTVLDGQHGCLYPGSLQQLHGATVVQNASPNFVYGPRLDNPSIKSL
jgi:hypothetical protein